MPSIHHLICFSFIGFVSNVLFVEAGWRPLSPSWASVRSRSPLQLLASSIKQTERHVKHQHQSLQHSSSLNPSSLFGVGNVDPTNGQRGRCLASIVSASIRGGGSDTIDDMEQTLLETTDDDQPESIESKSADKSKNKEEHDEERYSRQMYALGARAHQLVRSTTAILDGPLGGKRKAKDAAANSLDDVRIEGADGFDGLNSDANIDVKGASISERSETPSGLLYEIAKNLALSGVGRIVLVQDGDTEEGSAAANNNDEVYFDGSLDDLGAAYHRAALAEISASSAHHQDKKEFDIESNQEDEGDSDIEDNSFDASLDDGAILLSEYIQRLNPGVHVDIISREKLLHLLHSEDCQGADDEASDDGQDTISLGTNPVVVCVDRSTTSQLAMSDACRNNDQECSSFVPFISVETAGVHAKVFCDFGPKFVVVDEDGETSRATLLDHVEEIPEDESSEKLYTVNCLEGERHDVSKDDVIEFQGEHSDDQPFEVTFPKCQVVSVKSPTCFIVKEWDGESTYQSTHSSSMNVLLEGKARSFSRVKLPKEVSFSSLRDILQPTEEEGSTKSSNCYNDDTLFAPSDLDKSFDPLRRKAVMTSMAALDAFVTKYGRLPSRSHRENDHGLKKYKHRTDMERFQSLVRKMTNEDDVSSTDQDRYELLTSQFARTCRAKFTPVQALSGALGAQEVLKAATGLYNPVRQFLLYDCDEVLQQHSEEVADDNNKVKDPPSTAAAPGQSYILGNEISNKLARSRIFLVGAGAIGCELLKNLAAMGAGTGTSSTKRGCLILTDMDTIEKSNLSRQLLFRDHDVGEFKSVAARAAMMRFSPECRVEAHTSRVGEEEDGPFDDDFWSSGCSLVLNALDNVEARLFVDSQCVAHGLGLIDGGTLGPKGNVQVVVPGESESYGSSADPPEPDIAVCTLKNFPYEISHTIQWARDLFDGYFHRRPRQANDHVADIANSEDFTAFGNALIEKLGDDSAVDMAEELGEDLGPFPFIVGNADYSDPEYVSAVKKVSLNWAIHQAHRLFYVAMDKLIQQHPVDSVDDDGVPFWSGTRRVPRPLRFIPLDSEEDEVSAQQIIINERIAQFVRSAARLRMETFLPPSDRDDKTSLIVAEEALVALEEQAKILYKKKKSKDLLHNLSGGGSDNGDDTLSLLLDKLNGARTGASFLPRLNLADFEKDDESNGHVAFVTAASNLRAMSYGIPPADAMETRRVAGRIVPAMITTTGFVSALSCLELVKLLKGVPLTVHRNAFINLALPFFAFTAPMPAEEVYGLNGKTHTIWDRITVKGSSKSPTHSMTLSKFLKKIQTKAGCGEGIEVSSVSYGPYMIYANFLHSHDEELLEGPLLDTVRDAVISEDDDDDMSFFNDEAGEEEEKPPVELTAEQKTLLSKLEQKRFIDFSVAVEDQETGEEFELPPVRLVKDKITQQDDAEDIVEK